MDSDNIRPMIGAHASEVGMKVFDRFEFSERSVECLGKNSPYRRCSRLKYKIEI